MAGILGQSINVAQGLQGLALGRMQEEQMQQEQEKNRLAGEALKRYQDTSAGGAPDMGALNVAILNSPDMALKFQQATGLQDRIQKQDAAQFAINAAKVLDSPDEFRRLAQERIARVQARGGNPEQTVGMLQAYEQGNKEQVKNGLAGVAASLVATGDLKSDAYELAFGKVPESMNEYQKATIELDKQRLGLEQQRLASGGQMTAGEREFAKYEELLKTDPERAKVFGRARGFLSTEGQKLSVFDSKVIETASNEYSKLSSAASNYRMLAEKIKAANLTSGAMGTLQEYGKEMLGAQDLNTDLRKSVAQIVASEASKNLNPGSTTEREYAIAREPMPTGRGNSEQVARWLTAVANVSEHNAKFQEHKARFIGQYGGQRDPETGETVLSSWKKIQEEQAPANTGSSIDEKKKRLQELRAKQGG